MSKKQQGKNFLWHGIDARGLRTKGEICAKSVQEVRALITNQKITVLKITRKLEIPWIHANKKIKYTNITELSVELSTLISAGISLAVALGIMVNSSKNPVIKNFLSDIKQYIEKGHFLSEAIKAQSHYFDDFFYNLVCVGESSGTLDLILKHIASHREKVAVLKNKIKKALFYPCTVLIVALGVTCAMLVFIIPQFAHLFQTMGADLPMLTRLVLQSANFMRQQGALLLCMLIAGFFLLKIGRQRLQSWRYFFDRFWLQWPLIGKILLEAIFARCLHTLAITLQSGLPLLDALELTKNVAGNHLYAQGFTKVYQQIKNGQTLSIAMQNTEIFPARIVQMVAIGEQSGRLDQMLQKLADYFSAQVDDKVQNLSQLMEPALMIFLCFLVGTLVVAMYLPIFRLGSVF